MLASASFLLLNIIVRYRMISIMSDSDEVLTLREVAQILKLGHTSTYGMAQRGELPSFKVGTQWRFRRSEIDAWLNRRARAQEPVEGAPPILLIEDNPDDAEQTVRALSHHHVSNRIEVINDGAKAFQRLTENSRALPCLLLLDLNLPKVSGLKILEQVRKQEHTLSLPVVVLTSSEDEHDEEESKRLGVVAYLRKPVEFSRLADAVRTLGLSWSLQPIGRKSNAD